MTLKSYLTTHPKKYLLFDFDQTIFTLILPWEIYIKELTQQLLELDPSLKELHTTHNLNDLENEAVRRHGQKAVQLRHSYSREFEKKYLQGVEEHHEMTKFINEFGGAGDVEYKFYLWTSNMRETVEPVLKEHNLLRYFEKLVTKSDVQLTKPEPEGFYKIFDPSHHKKEEFLMIGDSINDKNAAKNAGIDFFSVTPALTPW
jgi:HAD superfamily hydrolase (TIGR01549 family)